MRDAQAALCVGLVDHVLRDFVLANAIGVVHLAGWIRRACYVVGVARITDGDELDVEGVQTAAEGIGL